MGFRGTFYEVIAPHGETHLPLMPHETRSQLLSMDGDVARDALADQEPDHIW